MIIFGNKFKKEVLKTNRVLKVVKKILGLI